MERSNIYPRSFFGEHRHRSGNGLGQFRAMGKGVHISEVRGNGFGGFDEHICDLIFLVGAWR
jgi:hypothetical protein